MQTVMTFQQMQTSYKTFVNIWIMRHSQNVSIGQPLPTFRSPYLSKWPVFLNGALQIDLKQWLQKSDKSIGYWLLIMFLHKWNYFPCLVARARLHVVGILRFVFLI